MKRGDIVKIDSDLYGVVDGFVSQVNTKEVKGVIVPYISVVYPYDVEAESVKDFNRWHEHIFNPVDGIRLLSSSGLRPVPPAYSSPRLMVEQGIIAHIDKYN